MQDIVKKAMRLKHHRSISVQLRTEVYDLLRLESERLKISTCVLARGILEDFYDKHCKEVHEDA